MHLLHYHSPVGILKISGDEEAIVSLHFHDSGEVQEENPNDVVRECARQLDAYFAGKVVAFSLPLRLEGTDFQKRIWRMVQNIPFGKTASYLNLALAAGDRNLVRAVGGANGANKLPLLIPCHRVVGANGTLTGYAGGLWRKKWLLEFELRKEQPQLFQGDTFRYETANKQQTTNYQP